MSDQKAVHTLVLDTGAIIKNEPTVSTLLGHAEALITVPAIISEIRDATTRSRVETTLLPFLTLRSPNPTSVKFVTDFARKTGDLQVLSKPDIQIIALTYELECERNGGDWRLRNSPGQKRVNGSPPGKSNNTNEKPSSEETQEAQDPAEAEKAPDNAHSEIPESTVAQPTEVVSAAKNDGQATEHENRDTQDEAQMSEALAKTDLRSSIAEDSKEPQSKVDSAQNSQGGSGSDDEGWITPSNLKKKQAKDAGAAASAASEPKTMQVGVLTSDFAMQNVILQINLNLLSPSLNRVKHLKTFVLRCHACFQVTKEMSKQFCPKCGQPTLTRVSCSTDSNGGFKLHLKKNMQWNTRGDRYSIPKPVHGSTNGRLVGGGKGGWGNDLILAEDQKEYQRAANAEKRQKERSLMDEDYLPGILTGDRGRTGGRIKVGAGRNVNARKR
ncbi:putative 20S-pre-rRNA D-site endonuclease nob1 [Hortaea werneckii]|nr:putative 20S-pre-rRNA D-site endonuclease nob1 [Hortaea werneckii]KAI6857063.1 putative 20S-pre-rRNA D-site endonuclease nob1 [Hortaea werneckii]